MGVTYGAHPTHALFFLLSGRDPGRPNGQLQDPLPQSLAVWAVRGATLGNELGPKAPEEIGLVVVRSLDLLRKRIFYTVARSASAGVRPYSGRSGLGQLIFSRKKKRGFCRSVRTVSSCKAGTIDSEVYRALGSWRLWGLY